MAPAKRFIRSGCFSISVKKPFSVLWARLKPWATLQLAHDKGQKGLLPNGSFPQSQATSQWHRLAVTSISRSPCLLCLRRSYFGCGRKKLLRGQTDEIPNQGVHGQHFRGACMGNKPVWGLREDPSSHGMPQYAPEIWHSQPAGACQFLIAGLVLVLREA